MISVFSPTALLSGDHWWLRMWLRNSHWRSARDRQGRKLVPRDVYSTGEESHGGAECTYPARICIVVSNCISKQRIGFKGAYLSYTARHLCFVLHFKGATLLDQHGRQGSNRLGAPGTYTRTLQTKPLIVQRRLQNAPLIDPGHTFYQPLPDSRFHIPV